MRAKAGVVAAFVAIVVLTGACGGDDSEEASTSEGPTGDALAEASSIDAAVDVSLAEADFTAVEDPVPVAAGDVVRTDDSGFAEVAYFDGSLTRLDVNTEFTVVELSDSSGGSVVRTTMGVGRTWNRVEDLAEGDEFVVETSVATATVRGTAFIVECPDDRACTFKVLEGTVEITVGSDTIELVAPSEIDVTAGGRASEPTPIDPVTVLEEDEWLARNVGLDQDSGFPEVGAEEEGGGETGSISAEDCARLSEFVATERFQTDVDSGEVLRIRDLIVEPVEGLPPEIATDLEALRADLAELAAAIDAARAQFGESFITVAEFRANDIAGERVRGYVVAECG